MEDLNDKITLGNLAAAEWNQVPSELQNVIEDTGQTLTNADLNQLGKGIADYVGNNNFYTDSGAADAYVLSTIGSKQSATGYTDGLTVEFIAGNSNDGGASTVNVATLGVVDIVSVGGGALIGGEIIAGNRITLKFDIGLGDFIIQFDGIPVGIISIWPTATLPLSHLECNGALILRATFPALFDVIGTTYGNNDGTDFNLPDLRGEFVRGFDNGAGNDPDAGSRTNRGDGITGNFVGTKQADELMSHSHELDTETSVATTGATTVAKGAGTGATTDTTGGAETRPRNVYMMYIIKF